PTPAPTPTDIIPTAPVALNGTLEISLAQRRYNLLLKWGASSVKGDIKEYIIFRNGIEISRTKSLTYIDSTIEANKPYIYAVQAVGTNGYKSFPAIYSSIVKCSWIFCTL
ncbi:MAG: hypothetical protein WCP56_03460, partial [Candidatus Saccharibacteria bacterium]